MKEQTQEHTQEQEQTNNNVNEDDIDDELDSINDDNDDGLFNNDQFKNMLENINNKFLSTNKNFNQNISKNNTILDTTIYLIMKNLKKFRKYKILDKSYIDFPKI